MAIVRATIGSLNTHAHKCLSRVLKYMIHIHNKSVWLTTTRRETTFITLIIYSRVIRSVQPNKQYNVHLWTRKDNDHLIVPGLHLFCTIPCDPKFELEHACRWLAADIRLCRRNRVLHHEYTQR